MSDIRSRRAGIAADESRLRPLYARVLGLQYVRPSSLMCFLFFEGTIALAVLLALAELVSWWAVLVLPVSVAVMVKINDVIAGASTRSGGSVAPVRQPRQRIVEPPPHVVGRASVPLRQVPEGYAALAFTDADDHAAAAESPPEVADALPEQAAPISPASEEPWVGSAEQRARQSATRRYE